VRHLQRPGSGAVRRLAAGILNGIEDIATRPDLANRPLFLTLEQSHPSLARSAAPRHSVNQAFQHRRGTTAAYFIWLSSLTAPASRRAASAVIPPAA
jgi:hypothetical protein